MLDYFCAISVLRERATCQSDKIRNCFKRNLLRQFRKKTRCACVCVSRALTYTYALSAPVQKRTSVLKKNCGGTRAVSLCVFRKANKLRTSVYGGSINPLRSEGGKVDRSLNHWQRIVMKFSTRFSWPSCENSVSCAISPGVDLH